MADRGPIDVTVTTKGFEELVLGVQALQGQVGNANKVATQIAAVMLARTRRRFLQERNPDGQLWPKSAAAIRRKSKGSRSRTTARTAAGSQSIGPSGTGGGTLFDTGALFNSIQASRASGGIVSLGTDVPYARKHQFGEGRLPERVFLGFGKDDTSFVEDFIKSKIDDFLKDPKKKPKLVTDITGLADT